MKNNITSSPTCMEDCHFLNFMSHLFQQHISAPTSLLVHSSPHITEMPFFFILSSFLVVAGAFLVKQH